MATTTSTTRDLTPERRHELRQLLANEIQSAHVTGVYLDATEAHGHAELHYIDSLIDDLVRKLRED